MERLTNEVDFTLSGFPGDLANVKPTARRRTEEYARRVVRDRMLSKTRRITIAVSAG
jgi:hypothetical protein